jgi:hypothetical protein
MTLFPVMTLVLWNLCCRNSFQPSFSFLNAARSAHRRRSQPAFILVMIMNLNEASKCVVSSESESAQAWLATSQSLHEQANLVHVITLHDISSRRISLRLDMLE